MSAAPSLNSGENKEAPFKMKILSDLEKIYKEILIKHLDERKFKEEKIYSWMNNILKDAKEYFIAKYPDYDIFLHIYICPKNIIFTGNFTSILLPSTDCPSSVNLNTDDLYSVLYFCFFKHYNLNYSLEEFENEIIQKGNDILIKYLEERKFNYDKSNNYNININNDHCNFIVGKENKCRCFILNEIYKNPIQNKYYFKYLIHGKEIYSKIIQTYSNDSLTCCHYVFFFK